MRVIRWVEIPEARQLAGLGKKLSRPAQARLQWMLFYFFNGRNAARTCRHFGISRQTFYRWKRRFDRHDLSTLEGRSHRPRRVRQPTWPPDCAERVLALRQQYPRWGKDKLAVLLRGEKCIVSTSMGGRIHHLTGNHTLFSPQQHRQLIFAPARVLLAERQNTFRAIRRPGWLAHPTGPMRAPFQGAEIVTVKAAFPAIKRLSADPKVTAGPRRIPAVEEIEQHPLKPRLRGPTQLLPEARQLAGLGNLNPPDYSHPDTLPSVTNHSERAQD